MVSCRDFILIVVDKMSLEHIFIKVSNLLQKPPLFGCFMAVRIHFGNTLNVSKTECRLQCKGGHAKLCCTSLRDRLYVLSVISQLILLLLKCCYEELKHKIVIFLPKSWSHRIVAFPKFTRVAKFDSGICLHLKYYHL